MNTTQMQIPSNKVKDIERYIQCRLQDCYPAEELGWMKRMLFEAFLGWDHVQLVLHRDDTINQSDLLRFHWAVEDLKKHRPIQYIIGWTDFCGCRIAVDESTLIPRPETEELLQQLFQQHPKCDADMHILDLCTGSGCMAIALAKQYPQAKVYGIDISEKALEMARKNAENNQVSVEFATCDLLRCPLPFNIEKYDIIVSNPPYVRDCEREQMQPNVLDYEPWSALFVPDSDPLLFYRAIAQCAQTHLKQDGTLLVEINEAFGAETCALFNNMGFTTALLKDFFDKARGIIAKRLP